jgi:uncharacterized protein YjbI with pentapeptide repeats
MERFTITDDRMDIAWRATLLFISGLAFASLLLACVLILPTTLVASDNDPKAPQALTQSDILRAKNAIRTTLLQGIGGLLLFVGAGVSLWQLRVTREGQITDRFTRAIDQLGNEQREVRIGGIYALERIAKNSVPDRRAISEVLSAYVRERAPWPPKDSDEQITARAVGSHGEVENKDTSPRPIGEFPILAIRAADVQAAMTVLGRRRPLPEDPTILRLFNVDLRKALLRGANLERASLARAHLEAIDLIEANLRKANLIETCLSGANLMKANLNSAQLLGSDLSGAHLEGADLTDANLKNAKLRKAHLHQTLFGKEQLTGARLDRADLRGADLSEALITGATLTGAKANGATIWPDGFDYRSAKVVISDDPIDRGADS